MARFCIPRKISQIGGTGEALVAGSPHQRPYEAIMRLKVEDYDSTHRRRLRARAKARRWLAWYPVRIPGQDGRSEIIWLSFVQRRWDKGWVYDLGDGHWIRGYALFGPDLSSDPHGSTKLPDHPESSR